MKQQPILIWDWPLRVFHWALVATVFWSWFSIEVLENMQQHMWSGYTACTLLIFRVLWGFVGSDYSRFSRLFYPPKEIRHYLTTLFSDQPSIYAGHNPLGSLAVILMISLLVAQVSTGLFSSDEYFYGPLAGLLSASTIAEVTDWHHRNFDAIKILIALHLVALVFYRWRKKQALTSAMLHGKKSLPHNVRAISSNRPWRALVALLVSLLLTYLLVNFVAEPVDISGSYY